MAREGKQGDKPESWWRVSGLRERKNKPLWHQTREKERPGFDAISNWGGRPHGAPWRRFPSTTLRQKDQPKLSSGILGKT